MLVLDIFECLFVPMTNRIFNFLRMYGVAKPKVFIV